VKAHKSPEGRVSAEAKRAKEKARSKHDLASWAKPPTINNQPL